VREIYVVTVKDYADRSGVTEFDFVKIEAEGVELRFKRTSMISGRAS
jgi:hypothetical protein